MVGCPVIHGYDFSKCLMDGGSSLNIMYVETLTKLGRTKTQLRHSAVTFYGVVLGRQAKSLRSIDVFYGAKLMGENIVDVGVSPAMAPENLMGPSDDRPVGKPQKKVLMNIAASFPSVKKPRFNHSWRGETHD
jgi:hypothetical protein